MNLCGSFFSIADNFRTVNGTEVRDGMSDMIREKHIRNIAALVERTKDQETLFSRWKPSTITASGLIVIINPDKTRTALKFREENAIVHIIKRGALLPPSIQKVGCNFGELQNETYVPPKAKGSNRLGRRPKKHKKPKRKVQGNGKYMYSQLTIEVVHPTSGRVYKVKVFRTGIIQCPGVQRPDMGDLLDAMGTVEGFMSGLFCKRVRMVHATALMRNYIWRLLDHNYHVSLERLANIIRAEKRCPANRAFVDYMTREIPERFRKQVKKYLGNINPLGVAEVTYNKDRCFYLLIKFFRATPGNKDKKTTCKLMKSGRVNFDGGLTTKQVIEIHLWLQDLYHRHSAEVIFDIETIVDHTDYETSECEIAPIYDDEPMVHKGRKRRKKTLTAKKTKKSKKAKKPRKVRKPKRAKMTLADRVAVALIHVGKVPYYASLYDVDPVVAAAKEAARRVKEEEDRRAKIAKLEAIKAAAKRAYAELVAETQRLDAQGLLPPLVG